MTTRRLVFLLTGATIVGCASGSEIEKDTTASGLEDEVIEVVEQLFTGMQSRDTGLLAGILDSTAQFSSVRDVGGTHQVRRRSATDFLISIAAGGDTLIERMWNPEVRMDGDVATLWAPYDFHLGDRFSHCGYDAFHLVRVNGRWRITAITYTVRDSACEVPPSG